MPAAFEPGPANPQPFTIGPRLTPHFDFIELLPPAGADRLRQLRQRSSDAHSLIPQSVDRLDATNARIEAEQRLARLTNHHSERGGGFNLKDDDPTVLAAKKLLDELTAAKARIDQRYNEREAEWTVKSAPLSAVEAWLKTGRPPGTVLEDHEVEVPKLAKGENGLLDQIENRRRRVRELRADLHRTRSASFPSSYCKRRLREMVEQLAARGAPNVAYLIEHDREIAFPMQRVQSQVLNVEGPAIAFAEVPDTLAVLAWTMKEVLLKRLDALVDEESDDAAALSVEARKKAEAEVMGDLLAVERDEAALCWRAIAERLPCGEFRADISPLAILGVALVPAPAVNPSPETSPGYSYEIRGRSGGERSSCEPGLYSPACTGAGTFYPAAILRQFYTTATAWSAASPSR